MSTSSVSGLPPRRLIRFARGHIGALSDQERYRLAAGFCGRLAFTLRGDFAKGVKFHGPGSPVDLDVGIDLRPSRFWKAPDAAFGQEGRAA